MKFGQFMSHYIRKNFITKFCKNCGLKTSSRSFCVCKELSTASIGNEIFEVNYLYQICNSKAIEICSNQHADLLRSLFTEDSLKIKKGLELVSRPHFSYNFYDKKLYFVILHKLAKFHQRLCLLPKVCSKMCFVFHVWAFDDVMTFEYLKS